jgi:hypothetical protein
VRARTIHVGPRAYARSGRKVSASSVGRST